MNESILIVDDDLGCGRLLSVLIRHLGYRADYVDSGCKALEYLSNHQPDLVILDLMMPDIDGLEVLRRVREVPTTARLPVVIFSALADPGFRQYACEHGADDYWVKAAFDFRDLERRIKPLLESNSLQN